MNRRELRGIHGLKSMKLIQMSRPKLGKKEAE